MKTEFNLNGINITVHADKDYLELIEHKACNQLEYHNPTDYGSLYRIMKSKNIKEVIAGNDQVNQVISLILGNNNLVIKATNIPSLKQEILSSW